MPDLGERLRQPGFALDLEWTGVAWTSVCPVDDVALTVRDDQGRSSCPACGRWHNELADLAKQR